MPFEEYFDTKQAYSLEDIQYTIDEITHDQSFPFNAIKPFRIKGFIWIKDHFSEFEQRNDFLYALLTKLTLYQQHNSEPQVVLLYNHTLNSWRSKNIAPMTKLTQYIHHTIKERLLATAPIKSLGAKTTGPLFIDNDWHPKLSPCARYINWEILYNDPADSQKRPFIQQCLEENTLCKQNLLLKSFSMQIHVKRTHWTITAIPNPSQLPTIQMPPPPLQTSQHDIFRQLYHKPNQLQHLYQLSDIMPETIGTPLHLVWVFWLCDNKELLHRLLKSRECIIHFIKLAGEHAEHFINILTHDVKLLSHVASKSNDVIRLWESHDAFSKHITWAILKTPNLLTQLIIDTASFSELAKLSCYRGSKCYQRHVINAAMLSNRLVMNVCNKPIDAIENKRFELAFNGLLHPKFANQSPQTIINCHRSMTILLVIYQAYYPKRDTIQHSNLPELPIELWLVITQDDLLSPDSKNSMKHSHRLLLEWFNGLHQQPACQSRHTSGLEKKHIRSNNK